MTERVAGEKGDALSALCTLSVSDDNGEVRPFYFADPSYTLEKLCSCTEFEAWLKAEFEQWEGDLLPHIAVLNGVIAKEQFPLLVRAMKLGSVATVTLHGTFAQEDPDEDDSLEDDEEEQQQSAGSSSHADGIVHMNISHGAGIGKVPLQRELHRKESELLGYPNT